MAQIEAAQKISCFHCGDRCDTSDISVDGRYFCCPGCKLVYELLSQNNLQRYYDFNRGPGINRRAKVHDNRFAFLDDDRVINNLLEFADGRLGRVAFNIPQIHCSSCVWLLENLGRIQPAIPSSRVDFMRKRLSLTFLSEKISLREVVELLSSLGYEPEINLASMEGKEGVGTRPKDHLYTRLAVAGFCFANVMLFSFPEYFSPGGIDIKFRSLFGALKVILALPVFFYSSMGFFKSAFNAIRQRAVNMDVPIALGIIILFGRSIFEILTGSGIGYMDSFTGLVFFLLAGRAFQRKTYESLSFDRDYRSYFPISSSIKENGKERTIPVRELKPGNRIVVRNGEIVPADSILLKKNGNFDYSFVTGESRIVEKNSGALIYAGGRVSGKAVELEIIKVVSESYLVGLWGNDAFEKSGGAKIATLANGVSRYFTFAVITIAASTGLAWSVTNPSMAVNAVTAVLIIACPCALALSTPFALGTTSRILGRNGLFLNNSDLVETMARADTIVFDKTGTLTESGQSTVRFEGRKLTRREIGLVRTLAAQSSHPLSRQIFGLFDDVEILTVDLFNEYPGQGLEGIIDGSRVLLGSEKWIDHKSEDQNPEYPDSAKVYLSIDGDFAGYFALTNKYRAGIKALINSLMERYRMILLSGDNDSERENIEKIFGSDAESRFDQSPQDKLDFISGLQSQDRIVLMIGDGLNDSGSLKSSDVGLAVSDNTLSFSPASDGILDSKRLSDLGSFLSLSRRSLTVIKASFAISFLYNIIGLSFAVAGRISPLLSAILMPLSSVSVVLFTTGATLLLARRLRLR